MKTHDTRANARADTAQHQPASAQADHGERTHPPAGLGNGLAQSAVDQSPRIVAQRRAIEATLGNGQPGQAPAAATGVHVASLGDRGLVAQLNGKRRRAKQKNKEKAQEARREAAIDRLNRGSPQTYSHLDPEVAANLNALDRMQPRKTAARRNIDSRETRLSEANLPSAVEVGAGEGRFSSAFSGKFGEDYEATDIASEKGPHGFLGVARKAGLRTKFGVNANELGEHYPQGSLDHVVGANPFGVKGLGGASYGLKVQNPGGTGKKKYLPDDRFLKTAKPLLKPGGSVELYGRSNVIRDAKLAKHPTKGLKGDAARQAEQTRAAISHKYPGENANPYLAIDPDELHTLAKETGYKATVKRAKQPPNIGKGGNPDTKSGDKERADEGLKPFTTRFTFTPEEEGYESDEDDPRVTYLSDDESDWEE
ncbi:class I SAM-dependent methyltransferase [Ideonella sp.]|uniref:class I SAM-dependent methyltransferase n=1 Tax=Ideonella sp. TaxID=1929293 RepID=UPI0035AE6ADC